MLNYDKIALKVGGMSCANCSLGIKTHLEKHGFKDVVVNFSTSEVILSEKDTTEIQKALRLIKSLGYTVEDTKTPSKSKLRFSIEMKFFITLIFTIPLFLAMFFTKSFLHNSYTQLLLSIPVLFIGIVHFGKSGYGSLKTGIANMDVLIITGSVAAFIYSFIGTILDLGHQFMFYETSSSIITIVLLGNLLEHRSVKKTTSAIDDLLNLQPKKARTILNYNTALQRIKEIDVDKVKINDMLIVNTGDKIPVDGFIDWGSAWVDESLLTGESMPVFKNVGDKIIAGSYVVDGNIKMKSMAVGRNTVLSQIIELVKNAQNEKPKLQNLADKISAIFVPLIILLAVITFLISYFLIHITLGDAMLRSVAVLVIACPCALGLAIPTAVVVGVGKMAKKGILVKGGITIDKFSNIEKIVFDKTGTITTGQFKIKEIKLYNSDLQYVKSVILGIEKHSSHPVAASLVNELNKEKVVSLEFIRAEEVKGMGIRAWDGSGNKYELGSEKLNKTSTQNKEHYLYLIINDVLKAGIEIEDDVKPDAEQVVKYFTKKGIQTILLSGDKKEKCLYVAQKTGIQEVFFEKLPAEKLEIISELSKQYRIAMLGDGINDAPALTKAHVGISLSNASDIAVQSSQIILLNGNLSLLIPAFEYSKKTLKAIKQNLFWAFFYNILAVPFAAAGYLSPMLAAFSMAASDVIVVLNSLRLKWSKKFI